MQAADDGYRFLKFFPGHRRPAASPLLKAWPARSPTSLFCPTGGISVDTRAGVPGAAERQGLSAARG